MGATKTFHLEIKTVSRASGKNYFTGLKYKKMKAKLTTFNKNIVTPEEPITKVPVQYSWSTLYYCSVFISWYNGIMDQLNRSS